MKPALLPVAEAQARLTALILRGPALPAEEILVTAAAGRVLAADLPARLTQPPADVSAMDGWAVCGADLASLPVTLTPIGHVAAGHPGSMNVSPGSCVRIFTGAPLPAGADTVVLQEDCETAADGRILIREGSAGRHVRRKGLDFTAGTPLLAAGRRLTARDIGLLVAAGHLWIAVRRKPRVAILATGDEILPPGSHPAAGQIISSNSYLLSEIVRQAGGEPLILGIARDDLADIRNHIRAAEGCDLLLTSGGASVGDHDLVQQALSGLGMVLDFWKIAMRPGKPLMVGALNGLPLIGLPGNPVSAFVCGTLFLRPAIAALMRQNDTPPPLLPAHLAVPLRANDQRQDYLRSRLLPPDSTSPLPRIEPLTPQDSSMLSALAYCNALLLRAPFDPARQPGEILQALPLDPGWGCE